MARELVKSPRGNSDVEKYTSDRLDGLFNKALQDIQTAFTFGYKRDLILAQSFANIKRGRLYKAKFKTFEEFVVAIGFNLSSADRYAQLGEGLREGVRRMKGDGKEIEMLSRKDVFSAFEKLFAEAPKLDIKVLAKRAKEYDSLVAYLAGRGDEKHVQNLLATANKESIEVLPALKQDSLAKSYQKTAAENGFEYDSNTGWYKNRDGSPLTNKQECEFISYSDAMLAIEEIEGGLKAAKDALEHALKAYSKTFWIYRIHGNNNKFRTDLPSRLLGINRRIEAIATLYSEFNHEPEGLR